MWRLYYVVHGREMRKCMSRSGSDPPRYRCGAHEGEGVGPLRRRCEDGPGGAVTALWDSLRVSTRSRRRVDCVISWGSHRSSVKVTCIDVMGHGLEHMARRRSSGRLINVQASHPHPAFPAGSTSNSACVCVCGTRIRFHLQSCIAKAPAAAPTDCPLLRCRPRSCHTRLRAPLVVAPQ